MKRFMIAGCALTGLLLTASLSWSCAVPVFRYALERWTPGNYEVVVFHDGKLSATQKATLAKLRVASYDGKHTQANFVVTTVDVSGTMDKKRQAMFKSLPSSRRTQLPVLAMCYPKGSPVTVPFWSGALNESNVHAVIDSKARQTLVQRIVKGQTAVWVLIDSGNRKMDDVVEAMLRGQLSKFAEKKNLPRELPLIFAGSIGMLGSPLSNGVLLTTTSYGELDVQAKVTDLIDRLSGPVMPLKLHFSVLRLRRNNPAEAVFINMLLHAEPNLEGHPTLAELKEPIVFPVFGRGRVRFALVGKGINADNITGDAAFLTGPCTCTIKNENPGFDVLMAADWDKAVGKSLVEQNELPPLIGIGGLRLPKVRELDPPTKPKKSVPPPDKQSSLWQRSLQELHASARRTEFIPFMEGVPTNPVMYVKLTKRPKSDGPLLQRFANEELAVLAKRHPAVVAKIAGKTDGKTKQASARGTIVDPGAMGSKKKGTPPSGSSNDAGNTRANTQPSSPPMFGLLTQRSSLIAVIVGLVVVLAVYLFVRKFSHTH